MHMCAGTRRLCGDLFAHKAGGKGALSYLAAPHGVGQPLDRPHDVRPGETKELRPTHARFLPPDAPQHRRPHPGGAAALERLVRVHHSDAEEG